jgi:hypothetical protein
MVVVVVLQRAHEGVVVAVELLVLVQLGILLLVEMGVTDQQAQLLVHLLQERVEVVEDVGIVAPVDQVAPVVVGMGMV